MSSTIRLRGNFLMEKIVRGVLVPAFVLAIASAAHAQLSVTLTPAIVNLNHGPGLGAVGSLTGTITVAPDYTFTGFVVQTLPALADGSDILTAAEIQTSPAFSSAISAAQPGQGYRGTIFDFFTLAGKSDGLYAFNPLNLSQPATVIFSATGPNGQLARTTVSYGVNLVAAPEPSALPLLALGLMSAGAVRARRRPR